MRPDLNLPAAVERVVLRALAKDPNNRPQNALVFMNELQAVVQSQAGSALLPSRTNQSPQELSETVAYDATTVAKQPLVIPISSIATKPMQAVQRPRKYKVAMMAFLLTALAGSGFIYYKFNPSLLSQLQGNTTKGEKEPAGARLSYQVLVKKKTGEIVSLLAGKEVHSGDQVRFKTLTPFEGTVYLLYEEKPENLVWINSVNKKAQQVERVDNTFIPVNEWLPITWEKKPTAVRLLLIVVPAGSDWSLEKALAPAALNIKTGNSNELAAAYIKDELKLRLLDNLARNAVSIPFSTMEQDQTRITQTPLPTEQNRVIYQWVELLQLP